MTANHDYTTAGIGHWVLSGTLELPVAISEQAQGPVLISADESQKFSIIQTFMLYRSNAASGFSLDDDNDLPTRFVFFHESMCLHYLIHEKDAAYRHLHIPGRDLLCEFVQRSAHEILRTSGVRGQAQVSQPPTMTIAIGSRS